MASKGTGRLSTGIEGIDEILSGGLIANRSYMLRGRAGSGKTILGLHFLESGIETGETGLFINLEEDLGDLKANAATLGFEPETIEFLDLSPTADVFVEDRAYDVFSAAEVEQGPLTEEIVETVRETDPDRVVVDPLTQLRYLVADDYQFRKQIVGFMKFLKEQDVTVMFTVQETGDLRTEDLEFITDGTVLFERTPETRTVQVPKFRGSATQNGTHTYRITGEGIEVFPELRPASHDRAFTGETVASGVPALDKLLDGGIERGTVTIISGPTGVGKTTLGTQFMKEAAGRGERSVVYLFEENTETFTDRSTGVNIPIEAMTERGTLKIHEVEALERTPQEFAQVVKREAENRDTEIVMLDGISGYRLTLRSGEDTMLQRLHALGRYLKNMGLTTILIDETTDVTGEFVATQENISYLADNIVFLQHLELQGEMRKAIGVLKKRTSDYERSLREFAITEHGITVGEPFTQVRGVLSGTPKVVDGHDAM